MSDQHPGYRVAAIANVAGRIGRDLPATGHVHTRALQSEARKLGASTEALGKVWEMQSPTETADAHRKKVVAAAKVYGNQVLASRDRIHDITRNGLADIDARSNAKTGLKADGFAGEVRATVRQLPVAERHTTLLNLATAGQGPELAAVIDAPPILTGISAEDAARYREVIQAKHAPAEFEEKRGLMDAFKEVFDLTSLCAQAAANFDNPALMAQIKSGEAAAADALATFNQAAQA